jgi:hypothetical protein
MQKTTREDASAAIDEALSAWDEDKWEAQEAVNRAAFAKEVGAVPWSGFNTPAPPKVATVSKERKEAALKRWLDAPLEPLATNVSAPALAALIPKESTHEFGKCQTPAEPERTETAPSSAVVTAIEAAVRQHRPRRPTPTRRLPHGSYTGVWIPKAVYEDPRFESHAEIILYLEVNHLDQEEGCKAKNKHFADYLGCSVQTVQDMIHAMTEREIFTCCYPTRRSRVIHIAGGRRDYSRHRA